MPHTIRLWVLPLVQPTTFALQEAVDAAVDVYARHRLEITVCGIVPLQMSVIDVRVGSCRRDEDLTADQEALFSTRGEARPNDVCVYLVRSTIEASNGCARHPAGRPGSVIVHDATRWTMGHEIGHVLGLSHSDAEDHLMVRGTSRITTNHPILDAAEVRQMLKSPLVSTTGA